MNEFIASVMGTTGAASGLDGALADKAAALGIRLVMADIDEGALQETSKRLSRAGVEVRTQACGVAKAAVMRALADAAKRRFGAIHMLFDNSGVADESSLGDWQWGFQVNVWGFVPWIQAFVPPTIAVPGTDPAPEGHDGMNASSMAGIAHSPLVAVYNAGGQAVTAISESRHHELQIADVMTSDVIREKRFFVLPHPAMRAATRHGNAAAGAMP